MLSEGVLGSWTLLLVATPKFPSHLNSIMMWV